jgi:hypothetical protein
MKDEDYSPASKTNRIEPELNFKCKACDRAFRYEHSYFKHVQMCRLNVTQHIFQCNTIWCIFTSLMWLKLKKYGAFFYWIDFFVWNRFSWYRWTKFCFIWLPFISFPKYEIVWMCTLIIRRLFITNIFQWNTTLLRWYHSNSSNSCCLSLIQSKFYKCVFFYRIKIWCWCS